MTDESEILNFVGEQFRRLNARFDNLEADVQKVKMRVMALDEHMTGIFIALSGVNTRLDRMDDRLKGVERRLDLTDVR